MCVGLKGLNTQQLMSKIGRANEQNRPNLEELQQRKIGSFWCTIGSALSICFAAFLGNLTVFSLGETSQLHAVVIVMKPCNK